jgi:hypothetical protein
MLTVDEASGQGQRIRTAESMVDDNGEIWVAVQHRFAGAVMAFFP